LAIDRHQPVPPRSNRFIPETDICWMKSVYGLMLITGHPLVNRVLTSPYLWWSDPFLAGLDPCDRLHFRVLAQSQWQ
jgi:hypothetical protein